MNLLAHIYLSGASEKIAIGNFIADSVKGKKYLKYEEKIAKGILLHRAIDTFTDKHPVVMRSTKRLYATQKRYAPVVVDIFYDHFLAKDWYKFHATPLQEFTSDFYEVLQQYYTILPKRVQDFLPYMIREDWLYNYSNLEGIARVLDGMANRVKFKSNMDKAIIDLKRNYQLFQEDFDVFFPEIIDKVRNQFSNDL
ncbi:MAG: ACP phosphodiesterase [Thermonemataceae bacterium]